MSNPLDKYNTGQMIKIVSFEEKTRGIFKHKDEEIQKLTMTRQIISEGDLEKAKVYEKIFPTCCMKKGLKKSASTHENNDSPNE